MLLGKSSVVVSPNKNGRTWAKARELRIFCLRNGIASKLRLSAWAMRGIMLVRSARRLSMASSASEGVSVTY